MAVSRRDRPPKPEPKEKPKVGQYEGKATPTGRATGSKIAPFTYPERQGFAGQLGNMIGRSVEDMSNQSIKGRSEANQRQYDLAIERYNGAFTEIERQSALREIEFLQNSQKELQEVARTGASGIRALGAAFEDRSLLANYGELSSAYPGEFTYQPPDLVGKAPSISTRGKTTTQQQSDPLAFQTGLEYDSPLATQQPQGGQQTGSAMAAWQGIPGESYPAAQAISPRGGYSHTPPGMPMGGLADSYRGALSSYVGPDQTGGTIHDVLTPEDEYNEYLRKKFTPIDTPPGGRYGGGGGFETYKDMFEAQKDTGRTNKVYSRGEMQQMMGGDITSANALKGYLGDPRSDYDPKYGKDQIQNVDMGQGKQDYMVRRDAYGNIRSYTPV